MANSPSRSALSTQRFVLVQSHLHTEIGTVPALADEQPPTVERPGRDSIPCEFALYQAIVSQSYLRTRRRNVAQIWSPSPPKPAGMGGHFRGSCSDSCLWPPITQLERRDHPLSDYIVEPSRILRCFRALSIVCLDHGFTRRSFFRA